MKKSLPTDQFNFFKQFSREQIIAQAKKAIEGFEFMLKKAKESKSGKYNGYTPSMLIERINFFKTEYEI